MKATIVLALLAGCAGAPIAAPPVLPTEIVVPIDSPPEPVAPAAARAAIERCSWPLWQAYAEHFISPEGRVIDHTDGAKSTSEGQAYGLFFALVAGDRPLFDQLLLWTEDNLAGGDLRERLPAWKWGRDQKNRWRILDRNAASDADLWIAYVLHEAGRIWSEPAYAELGARVLALIEMHEVADLRGLGPMLLPAPHGFEHTPGLAWRLNPSYLPPQLLRRFEGRGPWSEVLANTLRMLREGGRHGLAADWVLWDADRGFRADPVKGPVGSYDAIRVYLWASFLDPDDPLRAAWAGATDGLWRSWQLGGLVPEVVHVEEAATLSPREGPPGFVAVLLSEALARADMDAAAQLGARLGRSWSGGLYGRPPTYYDHNLILFARGHVEGRFSFARDGSLRTRSADGGCER